MMNPQRSDLESLESRCLLSSAALAGRTLRVAGDDSVDDTIVVSVNGDNFQVMINGGTAQTFAKTDVKRIAIDGKSGNDTITVDESGGALGVNVIVRGGDGNDNIHTGTENDEISAGAGD